MAVAAPDPAGIAAAIETSGNSFAAVKDIEEIKKVLPHRHAQAARLLHLPSSLHPASGPGQTQGACIFIVVRDDAVIAG